MVFREGVGVPVCSKTPHWSLASMATASIKMVKSDNFLLGLTIAVVITFGGYATSAVPRVI
jgi:hypothetical protein